MAQGYKTGGRQKGTPNKHTALLKDAIIEAAERAGDKEGLVGYLCNQATTNPSAFLALLGKVLPMQIAGADDGKLEVTFKTIYCERPASLPGDDAKVVEHQEE